MALFIHLWEWDRTLAYEGASGSGYLSIVDFISPTPLMNNVWHWEWSQPGICYVLSGFLHSYRRQGCHFYVVIWAVCLHHMILRAHIKVTICRYHSKGSSVVLSCFKTQSVGLVGIWTCNLLLYRLAFYQLSWPGGSGMKMNFSLTH